MGTNLEYQNWCKDIALDLRDDYDCDDNIIYTVARDLLEFDKKGKVYADYLKTHGVKDIVGRLTDDIAHYMPRRRR